MVVRKAVGGEHRSGLVRVEQGHLTGDREEVDAGRRCVTIRKEGEGRWPVVEMFTGKPCWCQGW